MTNCYFCHRPVFTTDPNDRYGQANEHARIHFDRWETLEADDLREMVRADLVATLKDIQETVESSQAAHLDCLESARKAFELRTQEQRKTEEAPKP